MKTLFKNGTVFDGSGNAPKKGELNYNFQNQFVYAHGRTALSTWKIFVNQSMLKSKKTFLKCNRSTRFRDSGIVYCVLFAQIFTAQEEITLFREVNSASYKWYIFLMNLNCRER